MARYIKADGTQVEVLPKNGKRFSLEELQGYVHGLIEMIDLGEGWMICNEEGKLDALPKNYIATQIARPCLYEFDTGIYGDVLLLSIAEADAENEEAA